MKKAKRKKGLLPVENQIIEDSLSVFVEKRSEKCLVHIEAEVHIKNTVKIAHRLYNGEDILAGQAGFIMEKGKSHITLTLPSERVEEGSVYLLKTELHDMAKPPNVRITQQLERDIKV